jgi:hypothetical protein
MSGKSRRLESHGFEEKDLEEDSHDNIWARSLSYDASPVIGIDLGEEGGSTTLVLFLFF